MRVLHGRGVAFVKFKFRAQAEFAKEAMFGQSLDQSEALNVRWASEDPNPVAKAEVEREQEKRVYDAVGEKLPEVGELGSVMAYQDYYDDPATKKRKMEEKKDDQPDIAISSADEPALAASASNGQVDYSQYYSQYGNYDDYSNAGYDNSAYAYDNSAYAYDNSAYAYVPSEPVAASIPASAPTTSGGSASTTSAAPSSSAKATRAPPPPPAKKATPAPAQGLVAYGSDEDD